MPSPSMLAMEEEAEAAASGYYYYLAGPMSGIAQYNFPRFDLAAKLLRETGYDVVSPAELDDPEARELAMASQDGSSERVNGNWHEFLRRDLNIVMDDDCLGVICITGWQQSKGAKLETYVAQEFDKPIYFAAIDWEAETLSWVREIDRDRSIDAGWQVPLHRLTADAV